MEFEIAIANCISNDKLHNDDIRCISDLLTARKVSIEDIISSLEAELVSPIVSQKKRGVEIIEQVLWSYLPNEDFTAAHTRLISCFVLNYISDWACVDGMVGIFKCIFSNKDSNFLKEIRIDIRDDEAIREEYSFSPIIELGREDGRDLSDLGPGRLTKDGRYFRSYAEICSYHKFNNHFGIEDAESDDDLYCMSIVFYLITQILYRVSTRQLVYSSRMRIIDLFLFVFSKREFHSELLRLGPGIVPIVMQHIENEKDPRVLIKAFPLVEHIIKDFQEVIFLYDSHTIGRGGGAEESSSPSQQSRPRDEYGAYQLYVGRLPKISNEERRRLELENGQEMEESGEVSLEPSNNEDRSFGGEDGILSHLVSEVLFSYFPLQFQSPSSSSQLPRTGVVSPEDLKCAYFSVITCSCLTQDSLIQAIVEYVDTQGLLESIITSHEDLHFEDERQLDRYLESNSASSQLSNKIIHMRQTDQDILGESLTLLSMTRYEISPEVVNKYISSIFLLIDELLKNTIVATEKTYNLLLNVVLVFVRLELGFKNGQSIVNTFVNQSIIPKLLLKLSSNQRLDLFAFNILQVFILTNNQVLIENIKNNFILVDIAKNNFSERVHINSKLLITLCILTESALHDDSSRSVVPVSVSDNSAEKLTGTCVQKSDSGQTAPESSFSSRASEFFESIERERQSRESGGGLKGLELSRLCLFLTLKCAQHEQWDVLDEVFQTLDFHWSVFDEKSEAERNLVAGLTSLLLFTNRSESRTHWRGYLSRHSWVGSEREEPQPIQSPGSILENLIYTVIREDEVPSEMATAFIDMVSHSVLDSISGDLPMSKWVVINDRVSNINAILSSEKWVSIRNFSIQCSHWVGTVIGSMSNIRDHNLILANKNLFYQVSRGLGMLTFRLFKHLSGLDTSQRDNDSETCQAGAFGEIESRLQDKASNHWLVCVYVNEILTHVLSGSVSDCFLLRRLGEMCSSWLNFIIGNSNPDSFSCEKAFRLANLEAEKLAINLLVLRRKGRDGAERSSGLTSYKGASRVMHNKTLRYRLFSEPDDAEDCYSEVRRQADEISRDLRNPRALSADQGRLESLSSCMFSLLHITGSDLSLLKNPRVREFSLFIGKSKYVFNKSDANDRESRLGGGPRSISLITGCNNNNTGKYLLELTKLRPAGVDDGKAVSQDSPLGAKSGEERVSYSDENDSCNPIEDLWPETIPLTDNRHHRVDLRCPRSQEKVQKLHQILVESFSDVYPVNPNAEADPTRYPLVLVPIVSSMSNLNIKGIINSLSSSSIQLILTLSLIECTNYSEYQPERLENPNLVKYLVEKASKGESVLDMESHTKEIKRLLTCKQEVRPCTYSEAWSKATHELQVHNMQSLSLLIQILHYSRENKLAIYEQRQQTRHSFDFVLDNLAVYSVLVSNILENHPNALVRFLCNLIISQIFKFPAVFRAKIKDEVVKSLSNSSNKDQDNGLRKMSRILKLKILTLNDHIY